MTTIINQALELPPKNNSKLTYYSSLISQGMFILLSILSFATINYSLIGDGFVLFSLFCRLLFPFIGILGIRRLFILKNADQKFYEGFRQYSGYAIPIVYVFYSLPSVVGDFQRITFGQDNTSPLLMITNIVIAFALCVFYLTMHLDIGRLALGVYTTKDLKRRETVRKDKEKRKAEARKMKKERNFIQNLWFEWIEPLLGAVIWVMLIHHFLFQLFQIPSESMVPTFLIKDRVVALKTQYSPTVPLTRWHLPRLSKPETGDIITFLNPRVDNPLSDVAYKNVFTRVFHPFVYMITFTTVDIDKKPTGLPKERLLVKRVIGEPGDRLCMLNDEIWKETDTGEWVRMDDIPGQREYGRDLYYDQNPKMQIQLVNRAVRDVLDQVVTAVDSIDDQQTEDSLVSGKPALLQRITAIDETAVKAIDLFLMRNQEKAQNYSSNLNNQRINFYKVNTLGITAGQKSDLQDQFTQALDDYRFYVFYTCIVELRDMIYIGTDNPEALEAYIATEYEPEQWNDPYHQFMVRVNGLYKEKKLSLFTDILDSLTQNTDPDENSELISAFNDAEEMNILFPARLYSTGIETATGTYSYFQAGHFPPFPSEEGEAIPEGEYFLMGDNRYNSSDSRMGKQYVKVYFDPEDTTPFGISVWVPWDMHTINEDYIQGKIFGIFFPFDRFKIF